MSKKEEYIYGIGTKKHIPGLGYLSIFMATEEGAKNAVAEMNHNPKPEWILIKKKRSEFELVEKENHLEVQKLNNDKGEKAC